MSFSSNITKALIENSTIKLNSKDIERLLKPNKNADRFIAAGKEALKKNDKSGLYAKEYASGKRDFTASAWTSFAIFSAPSKPY